MVAKLHVRLLIPKISYGGGGTYLYQSIHSSYFCCTELTPFQHTLSQPKMEEYFLTPR